MNFHAKSSSTLIPVTNMSVILILAYTLFGKASLKIQYFQIFQIFFFADFHICGPRYHCCKSLKETFFVLNLHANADLFDGSCFI